MCQEVGGRFEHGLSRSLFRLGIRYDIWSRASRRRSVEHDRDPPRAGVGQDGPSRSVLIPGASQTPMRREPGAGRSCTELPTPEEPMHHIPIYQIKLVRLIREGSQRPNDPVSNIHKMRLGSSATSLMAPTTNISLPR